MGTGDHMSENSPEKDTEKNGERDHPEQEEIAEVQQQLDEESDGEGLAAEAGRGEETGLSEG